MTSNTAEPTTAPATAKTRALLVQVTLPACFTFDDITQRMCFKPARYVVWGHLYEKREKCPNCGDHLPQSVPERVPVLASPMAVTDLYAVAGVLDAVPALLDQVDTHEPCDRRLGA